ncbi:MAG TPA: hypothetical protein DEH11_12525, partial [Actinobacteria bacterium]|nr:hypothetical protein [Actinomycetota bacterium]
DSGAPDSSAPDSSAPAGSGAGPAVSAAPDADTEVTLVPGIARYHRAECILIRFLGPEDLDTTTRSAAEEAGCAPCKACRPDQATSPDQAKSGD